MLNACLESISPEKFLRTIPGRRHAEVVHGDNRDLYARGLHFGLHEYYARQESTGRTTGERYWVLYQEYKDWETILLSLSPVWKFLDNNLSAYFPGCYQTQYERATCYYKLPTLYESAFHSIAVNRHPFITSIHTDGNAYVTGLFVGGDNFHGGALCFPQLNVRLHVVPGDVVWTFADLIHYVEPVNDGIRHSLSVYSKHLEYATLTNNKTLQVPPDVRAFVDNSVN